jgi:hypothetical protein
MGPTGAGRHAPSLEVPRASGEGPEQFCAFLRSSRANRERGRLSLLVYLSSEGLAREDASSQAKALARECACGPATRVSSRATCGSGGTAYETPARRPLQGRGSTCAPPTRSSDLRNRPATAAGHQGPGSRAAGILMAFKLIESAQHRWRAVNSAHLVALVRAGPKFENGVLVERPDESASGDTHAG